MPCAKQLMEAMEMELTKKAIDCDCENATLL